MLNLLLVLIIIALSSLLFSEDTFSRTSSNERTDATTQQAACYARILGIQTPKVTNRPYSLGNRMGITKETIHGVTIELYKGHTPETLAHEVRHAYQVAHGWPYELHKPYEMRRAEIDAYQWADQNHHRCPPSQPSTQPVRQAPTSSCQPYTVVAGDSWFGIARKFGKSSAWISQHKQQALHPNQKVCI